MLRAAFLAVLAVRCITVADTPLAVVVLVVGANGRRAYRLPGHQRQSSLTADTLVTNFLAPAPWGASAGSRVAVRDLGWRAPRPNTTQQLAVVGVSLTRSGGANCQQQGRKAEHVKLRHGGGRCCNGAISVQIPRQVAYI